MMASARMEATISALANFFIFIVISFFIVFCNEKSISYFREPGIKKFAPASCHLGFGKFNDNFLANKTAFLFHSLYLFSLLRVKLFVCRYKAFLGWVLWALAGISHPIPSPCSQIT